MIFCVDYQHFVYEALRLPGNILSVSLLPVGLLVADRSSESLEAAGMERTMSRLLSYSEFGFARLVE